MRLVSKIALAVGVLLILVVVGISVVVATLDVNEYRGTIERAATEATGRKLDLSGPIDFELGFHPSVVAEDVRFANAPWGSRPDMIRMDRLAVQVELWPLLFDGELRVRRIVLLRPDVFLETNAEGEGNWKLETGAADEDGTAEEEPADEAAAWALLVADVRLDGGELVYRDGETGETQTLTLERAHASADSFDEPLLLDVVGEWQETAFSLEGSVGALETMLEAETRFPVDLRGHVSAIGDLALAARVVREPDRILLDELDARVGESRVTGHVEVRPDRQPPYVEAALESRRIEVPSSGGSEPEAAPPGPAGKVLPPDPLPFDVLRTVDTDGSLRVGDLVLAVAAVEDLVVDVALEGGALSVDPLRFGVGESKPRGRVGIDASGETPTVVFELEASAVDVGRLLREAEVTDLLEGRADLGVHLRGRGRSVAAIAGSLDGEITFLMEDGRARTKVLEYAIGGMRKIGGMFFAEDSEWSTIHCAAANLRFERGTAHADVLLVDTEHSTIVGDGSANLGDETLDLEFAPEPKKATLTVAVPIEIGGTFAEPTFRPDKLATARKVGGLLSIALFPPAAIGSLGELGSGDNACLKLAEDAAGEVDQGLTGAAKDTGRRMLDGAQSIGEGVKDLFGGND